MRKQRLPELEDNEIVYVVKYTEKEIEILEKFFKDKLEEK